MTTDEPGEARYATSQHLMDLLRYGAEALSLEFTRWDEPYATGPSLYFLVVADVDFGEYTDPLGSNRWPVDECEVVTERSGAFIDAARQVAFDCDGAIVVAADGTIQEQMVRVRSPSAGNAREADELTYADWMGTKHLSAMETSTRKEVLWAVTLSEESGRVTTFLDGTYRDYPRDRIGGRWRPS
jgi:hypothetical protein